MLSGLTLWLAGWRWPRWGSPEYRLLDTAVAVFVVSGVAYVWTEPSALGIGATAAPTGVLEMFSGLAYGQAQTVLGYVLMGAAVLAFALAFRPDATPAGYRFLFVVSAWWCFQLVWGMVIFDLPARNLLTAFPYGLVASWLFQTMPTVVDYADRPEGRP